MKMFRTLIVSAALLAAAPMAWAEDPVGQWTGTLTVQGGQTLAVGLKVTKGADGKMTAVAESAQSPDPIPVEAFASDGSKMSLTADSIQGKYEAAWDDASKTWKGTWTQNGQAQPLVLTRKS